jgi:hypothetical protein
MDMSYLQGIPIERGVMLTSELPRVASPPMALRRPDIEHRPLARDAGHLGPRLYTRTRPLPLFEIVGDNVLLEGFRLQGPDFGIAEGDDQKERGIMIMSQTGIEIREMEFSGWGGQAIYVGNDERDHRHSFDAVVIHDNFFHHNQHISQLGYGVSVGSGAHALIERNVFDWNRHAITADGTSRTGYRAYRNLVLENGGLNTDIRAVVHLYTQQFDMHGLNDVCLTFFGAGCLTVGDHYVGQAGHDYDVRYNSFLYTAGPAIKLRGTPQLGLPGGAVMRFNVFAHDNDQNDAVQWTEGEPVVQDNLPGRRSYAALATCDFDGDGINDMFIATEQTMWYCPGPSDCVTAPGSGKPTWVYLNSSTKRTDQLALGFFSGGRVCDVADGTLVSIGGWGSWRPLTKAPRSVGTIPRFRQ